MVIENYNCPVQQAEQATIVVRAIRDEEIPAVSELVHSAYASDFTLPSDYLAEIADVTSRVASAEVLVAETAGEIVGTVTIPKPGERLQDDTLPDEMDLRLLGVSHAARKFGVGEALMHACIAVARARGYRRLVLHTGSMMLGAQRLYERLGFERIPEREFELDPVVEDEPRLLMAYGLTLD